MNFENSLHIWEQLRVCFEKPRRHFGAKSSNKIGLEIKFQWTHMGGHEGTIMGPYRVHIAEDSLLS